MKRLRLLILFSVAILFIGITTDLTSAREGHLGHVSDGPALDGPLSVAQLLDESKKLTCINQR